jgi:hypothetical protein
MGLAGNLARWALLGRLTGYGTSHFFSFFVIVFLDFILHIFPNQYSSLEAEK